METIDSLVAAEQAARELIQYEIRDYYRVLFPATYWKGIVVLKEEVWIQFVDVGGVQEATNPTNMMCANMTDSTMFAHNSDHVQPWRKLVHNVLCDWGQKHVSLTDATPLQHGLFIILLLVTFVPTLLCR